MQQYGNDQILYSPSDLLTLLGCQHASFLDVKALSEDMDKVETSTTDQLLQKKGLEHEAAYLRQLKDEGKSVVEIPKNHPVQLLAAGERIVCFAAADDWINLFETESAAHKTKNCLHQPATEKQLRHLPPEYRNDYSLIRYKASALMTMRFNNTAIRQVIENGRVVA